MPNIHFIAAHRRDRSPSQRFRFEQYFEHLSTNHWKVSFSFIINEWADKVLYSKGKILAKGLVFLRSIIIRTLDTFKARRCAVTFVQREALMTGSIFFEKQFAKRSKLVFDFDDSIWLHDVNPKQGLLNKMKDPSKTSRIIEISDLVIAGNEYLAGYARQFNPNVIIIPTTIDTEEYRRIKIEKDTQKVCIGWSGSFSTIKHFETVLPALNKLKVKYGDKIYFKVIGDGNYRHDDMGIVGLPWRKESELEDLSEIDIGLMPLPNDEWSRGKCGLKGLQYMALEIATIMSDVGVNGDIIDEGKNGYLAVTEEDWIEKISLLIDSRSLRSTIGEAGRETVITEYSVTANKEKYLEAFNSLLAD